MFSSEVLRGFISLWTISKQTHKETDIKSQWEGKSGAETTDVDWRKEKGQSSKSGSKRNEGKRNYQTFSAMSLYNGTQRHFVKAFHKTSSILNQVYALLSFFIFM